MSRNKNETPIEIPAHLSKEEAEIYVSVLDGLDDFKYWIVHQQPRKEGWLPNVGPTMPQLMDMKYKLEGKKNPLAEETKKIEDINPTEEEWETVYSMIKNSTKPK